MAATESWSSAEADSIIKNASTPAPTQATNGSDDLEIETYVELPVGFGIIRVQQRGRPTQSAPIIHTPSHSSAPIIHIPNEKKRALPSPMGTGEAYISGKETKKRQRQRRIDLTNVHQLQPIPKSKGRMKEGASQYTGDTFHKSNNKWLAQIKIDRMKRHIGYYYYENEEEAAADNARAKFKYKGQEALDKVRERKSFGLGTIIDLTDVPPQPPILKSKGRMKEGSSKYTGIRFYKPMNKWRAEIRIDGRKRHIGYYENEEEAAIDYARALFKYKDKGRVRTSSGFVIDVSDVTPQLPIPKSKGRMKEGASKFAGVYFNKLTNNWQARTFIEGKSRHIGNYENDEEAEAAVDYARAVFKYRGVQEQGKVRQKRKEQVKPENETPSW